MSRKPAASTPTRVDEGCSVAKTGTDAVLNYLLWTHRPPNRPAPRSWAEVAPSIPESAALARELKGRGFRFVGPTTVYAMMQAVGVANDHLAACFVRDEVEALRVGE